MNILLIIITLVCLAFAVVSLVLNWRLAREERRRSAARVEVLLEAASAWPAASAEGFNAPTKRETRSREPAPAAQTALVVEPRDDAALTEGFSGISHELFHEPAQAPSGFHRLAVPMSLGVVIVTVVLGGLLIWNHERAKPVSLASAALAADKSVTVPLELISLRHERTAEGLSITGLVRNPASGHRVSDLNVVVFVFDRNGSFVTSARGPLDFRTLAPGEESPFTISLDKIGSVGRYRVSFRADDQVAPHVDRRRDLAAFAEGFGVPGRSDTRSPAAFAQSVGGPTRLEERSRVVTVATTQPH